MASGSIISFKVFTHTKKKKLYHHSMLFFFSLIFLKISWKILCSSNNLIICKHLFSTSIVLLILQVFFFLFLFQGGVILVSHDERLIRLICNELWVVQNGTVSSLEGGFDEYKQIVEKELQVTLWPDPLPPNLHNCLLADKKKKWNKTLNANKLDSNKGKLLCLNVYKQL